MATDPEPTSPDAWVVVCRDGERHSSGSPDPKVKALVWSGHYDGIGADCGPHSVVPVPAPPAGSGTADSGGLELLQPEAEALAADWDERFPETAPHVIDGHPAPLSSPVPGNGGPVDVTALPEWRALVEQTDVARRTRAAGQPVGPFIEIVCAAVDAVLTAAADRSAS